MKIRVIIGQGTAAEAFRSTSPRSPSDGWKTIILGERGLWSRIKNHQLAQPPHILQIPGQRVPDYRVATGTTTEGMKGFHSCESYQQELMALSDRNFAYDKAIELNNCIVKKISRGFNNKIKITTTSMNPEFTNIDADEVIIATGMPPQQRLKPTEGIKNECNANLHLGFTQIQEGVEYLVNYGKGILPPTQLEVALFGSGATSSWIAELVMLRKPASFTWYERLGGNNGFNNGSIHSPGKRNAMIMELTKKHRDKADLLSVNYLKENTTIDGITLNKPKLRLKLKLESGQIIFKFVDQVLYSTGVDSGGEGGIEEVLDSSLRKEIIPIYDQNRVLGDNGQSALAWGNHKHEILIIGAAAYHYRSLEKVRIPPPMSSLPFNAQVIDGISVGTAATSALNNYIPIRQDWRGNVIESNVNINLADRNQLAAYIAVFYPYIKPAAANEIIVRTIKLRSIKADDDRVFGVSPEHFQRIIKQYISYDSRSVVRI
jgi:hypothetical protein